MPPERFRRGGNIGVAICDWKPNLQLWTEGEQANRRLLPLHALSGSPANPEFKEAGCSAKKPAYHASYRVQAAREILSRMTECATTVGCLAADSVFARDKCGRSLVPVRSLAAAHWQGQLVRLASYPPILRCLRVHFPETGSRHGRVIGAKVRLEPGASGGRSAIETGWMRCVMVLLCPKMPVAMLWQGCRGSAACTFDVQGRSFPYR